MNDTQVTLVGNVATEPEAQMTAKGVPFTRFRLATSARRWDPERGAWTDGFTSFYTIRTWRTLAGNVKESVGLGEPLVVHGRLRIREEERDGRRHASAEIEASAVGHDLARGVTRYSRVTMPPRAVPDPQAAPAAAVPAPGSSEPPAPSASPPLSSAPSVSSPPPPAPASAPPPAPASAPPPAPASAPPPAPPSVPAAAP